MYFILVFFLLFSSQPVYANGMDVGALVCSIEHRSCGFLKSCEDGKCRIEETHRLNRFGVPTYITGSLSGNVELGIAVTDRQNVFSTNSSLDSILEKVKVALEKNEKNEGWACFERLTIPMCGRVNACNETTCRVSYDYALRAVKTREGDAAYELSGTSRVQSFNVKLEDLQYPKDKLIMVFLDQQIKSEIFRLNLK